MREWEKRRKVKYYSCSKVNLENIVAKKKLWGEQLLNPETQGTVGQWFVELISPIIAFRAPNKPPPISFSQLGVDNRLVLPLNFILIVLLQKRVATGIRLALDGLCFRNPFDWVIIHLCTKLSSYRSPKFLLSKFIKR